MSVRLPQSLTAASARDSGLTILETELASEKAGALGRLGRALEKSLADLAAAEPETRPILLKTAAEATWRYFVQREACGLRDHREAIRLYGIPKAVLMRVGAS